MYYRIECGLSRLLSKRRAQRGGQSFSHVILRMIKALTMSYSLLLAIVLKMTYFLIEGIVRISTYRLVIKLQPTQMKSCCNIGAVTTLSQGRQKDL